MHISRMSRLIISVIQITCLYDMDIPRPDNFNETYLYEGACMQVEIGRDAAADMNAQS